ncbi:MAG: hypothetical protein PUG74_10465 [Prevotellaceae bacterium]|nr:hypothetical protein [Prevotellaceae bacterium]
MLTPLTMGIPALDESLQSIFDAMKSFPSEVFFSQTLQMAKVIGLLLALCVGAYESWMMMLGRRVIDVMKLLRIVGLSMCISFSGTIADTVSKPGFALEKSAQNMASVMNTEVARKEKLVAKLQSEYLDRLRTVQDSLDRAREIQQMSEDEAWYEKIMTAVSNLGTSISNNMKRLSVLAETKITEWINDIARFLGEVIFQLTYYGLFLANRCFMCVLRMFAPIAFALSIVPPWSSAWSQWISKYISLSLWGVVIYIVIYYVDFIMLYTLEKDIKVYTTLINTTNGTWGQIGTLGMQGIGTTCMYIVALLSGAFALRMVPEVASWLIPGGVSSSIGSAAGTMASAAVGSSIGTTVSVAAGAAGGAVSSGSVGGAFAGALRSSSIGHSYSTGKSQSSVPAPSSSPSPSSSSLGAITTIPFLGRITRDTRDGTSFDSKSSGKED